MATNKKISIVVRTKNEEKWIGSCLESIFKQDYPNFEVILVDDRSKDRTCDIASKFPVKMVHYEGDYFPGKCLNFGFSHTTGDLVACISGHCVPTNETWLSNLARNFSEPGVVGVYGRQEPLPFSSDSDKRDLLTIFGLDRKIQKKDSFFHNANSMVRRSAWEECPWDDAATNIEDRLWAQKMLMKGRVLIYEPEASVFHWHGIHQDGNKERCKNVVRILESLSLTSVPHAHISHPLMKTVVVIPVRGQLPAQGSESPLRLTIEAAQSSKDIHGVYVATDSEVTATLAKELGAKVPFLRPAALSSPYVGIEDVLKFTLTKLHEISEYPDLVVLMTPTYPFRKAGLLDDMISELLEKRLDLLIPAYREANPCFRNSEDGYEWLDDGFMPRKYKDPIYVSVPGIGMVMKAGLIGTGKFKEAKVGIFPIDDEFSRIEIKADTNPVLFDAFLTSLHAKPNS